MQRLSDRLPVIFLSIATVLGGIGVGQAWRAARANDSTADGVLRDYAQVAAWSFGERIRSYMGELAMPALEPFLRDRIGGPALALPADVEAFRARALASACAACGAVTKPAFHFRLPVASGVPEFAGTAPAPSAASALASAVRSDVPAMLADPERRPFGFAAAEGTTVVYTLRVADGEPIAWGFALDGDAARVYLEALLGSCSLLPPVLIAARPNTEVLALSLLAPDGSTLFSSGPHEARLAIDHPIPDELTGLTVRASILPAIAQDLIIGGIPRSRLPLMIGLFALAAVLTAAAVVQMRRAQELARLRSEFVAGVSHELRTPLAQIRIYADTLALGRAQTGDRRRWSIDGLRRETTRLEHLVDNILHSARATDTPDAAEPHAPARTVEQAVDEFRPLAASRAELRLTIATHRHVCMAPDALRQVVCNLLDNAVKYGPRGQCVHVAIDDAGTSVRITVDDQGPGIDPSERESVWTMYRRGRDVAGVVGGSGVGLAVVRRIVEDHGGRVGIDASPSGGARFIIELPAGPAPAGVPDDEPATGPALAAVAGD